MVIKNSKVQKNAKININIHGSGNEVVIEDGFGLNDRLDIRIGQKHKNFGEVRNHKFRINQNTSVESLEYVTYNSNSSCTIGENCMIAYGVTIFNTDAHPVFDINTGKLLNKVNETKIGNHCWLGAKTTVLKNTVIPDNCILGYGAIASGKFEEEHCVLAGNPAKIVKRGVTWDACGAKFGYIENER